MAASEVATSNDFIFQSKDKNEQDEKISISLQVLLTNLSILLH